MLLANYRPSQHVVSFHNLDLDSPEIYLSNPKLALPVIPSWDSIKLMIKAICLRQESILIDHM